MDVQDIHARLRAAGRTLAELGQALGLSHSQVSRLLSGKSRMRLDVMRQIEAYLEVVEAAASGVREERAAYAARPTLRSITLEEARAMKDNPPPPIPREVQEEAWARIHALTAIMARLPRVTDMTDDEILGYDENGVPT